MRSQGTRTAVRHLVVELFFAILPLIVLGSFWPGQGKEHSESFWAGPEMSMTSCILYGLTLARFLQGSIFAVRRARPGHEAEVHMVAASYAALSLMPLLGVIVSVITISKSLSQPGGNTAIVFNVALLLIAVLCFFILGGHGIERSEAEDA